MCFAFLASRRFFCSVLGRGLVGSVVCVCLIMYNDVVCDCGVLVFYLESMWLDVGFSVVGFPFLVGCDLFS